MLWIGFFIGISLVFLSLVDYWKKLLSILGLIVALSSLGGLYVVEHVLSYEDISSNKYELVEIPMMSEENNKNGDYILETDDNSYVVFYEKDGDTNTKIVEGNYKVKIYESNNVAPHMIEYIKVRKNKVDRGLRYFLTYKVKNELIERSYVIFVPPSTK